MNRISGRMGVIAGLVATTIQAPVALAAQQTPPAAAAEGTGQTAPAAPGDGTVADAGYVLGSGDVIEVAVVGRGDYRARVRVQIDGSVQLPLVGSIPATGRTTLQLGDEIGRALRSGGYFAKPVVSVEIASYSSRYVTVLGEVGSPGLVPIDRSYRASEILARVGGVKENGADMMTLRRASGEEQQLSVKALATGGPAEDPVISPGDKLYVPQAERFYIYGQVTAPGTYRLDPEMNLRKAIARGGGLTESGSDKRARVYRQGQELERFKLEDPLLPGDVVVIGERFF